MEKNQYAKQFNTLEIQNDQLLESLSCIENEKDEVDKTNQSLQLIVTAHRYSLPPQNKLILEEDGIKCFDLDYMQSEAQEDLRMSIGAQTKMPPPKRRGRSATEETPE